MDRYKFLPSYHYEDNTDGNIQNPATDKVRTCTIYGNHGKNLFPYPFAKSTTTVNGITFTDNGDGTITANGTATATAEIVIITTVSNVWIKAGVTYTLSGTPSDGAYNKWYMYSLGLSSAKADMGKSVTFTGDDTDKRMSLVLRVANGVTAENVVFKPQLEEGEAATAFEKWCGVGDKTINEIPSFSDGTKTASGITFTDNGDGSLTLNGTATPKNAYYAVWSRAERVLDKNKTYLMTNETTMPNADAYMYMDLTKSNGTSVGTMQIGGLGYKIADLSQYDFDIIRINLVANYQKTFENAVYKPILIDMDEHNLIPYPYARTTQTVNGVTTTDNGDGSVTVNGTATDSGVPFWFTLEINSFKLDVGKTYCLIGCPITTTGTASLLATLRDGNGNIINNKVYSDSGKGTKFTVDTEHERVYVYLYAYKGAVFDNLTFRPRLIPIDFEPYGYRIPVANDTRENLIPYPYSNTTKTSNGLTFTDNKDGTITVNGTATGSTAFYLCTIDRGIHFDSKISFSGCPDGGSGSTYGIYLTLYKVTEETKTYVKQVCDVGTGAQFDCSLYDYTAIEYNIIIHPGAECNNLIFKPRVILSDVNSETTNIYSPKQIMQGETETFNEPFKLSKANQISVETAVKPSAVKYTYYTY